MTQKPLFICIPYAYKETTLTEQNVVLCIRFAEPLVFGDYPKSMRELVKERLPKFSEKQKVMLKGAHDFLGINYYLSSYAQSAPNSQVGVIPHHRVDALALELGEFYILLYNI